MTFYHQVVNGYGTTCYEFLDNFIEIWIKLGFEEKWKGIPHTQVYFQAGSINMLQIAFFKKSLIVQFRLYLK